MKLKNILLSGLSLVLVAALAIGGTVAYLQDEDSDVNVMTLGNVKIEQHEYERATNTNGSYETKEIDGVTSYVLKDFTQGKPLYPIVGDPNEPGNSPAYAVHDYFSRLDRIARLEHWRQHSIINQRLAVHQLRPCDHALGFHVSRIPNHRV